MKKRGYFFALILMTLLMGSCASDRGRDSGEVMNGGTAGEAMDHATTREAMDDATAGEAMHDATTLEAMDDATTREAITPGTPVSDVDGNSYQTVIIGEQEWMAQNLKTTTYRNGEPIEYPGEGKAAWRDNTSGAYAWYDNNPANKETYGGLYNWYAVTSPNGLCPEGWRMPDEEDWLYLTDFVGDEMGNKLKSRRQVGSPFGGEYDTTEHPRWETFTANYGLDEVGFGALPGGNRHASGSFVTKGANALFWSASEISEEAGFGWFIYHGYYGVDRGYGDKGAGFSVRCIRD